MASAPQSLRRRLTLALVSAFLLVGAVTAFVGYRDAHRAIDELLDAHLVQAGHLIGARALHEIEELDPGDLDDHGPWAQQVWLRVWDEQGRLMFSASGAPDVAYASLAPGLHDVERAGRRWRVFVTSDRSQRLRLQLAEAHDGRERLARRIALDAVLPLLLALPLLALLVAGIVNLSLRPLVRVGAEIARRGPRTLEPLAPGQVPAEVVPLVERLNQLLGRVAHSLEQERRFASNAAHELRNPLAALRAQAELALSARSATETRAALESVIAAADRLARMVQQLLALARVEEPGAAAVPLRLDQLARDVLAELAPAALRDGAELALDAPHAVELRGNASLLEALLRNLVENALRHGGPGVHVEVIVARDAAGRAQLRVRDDGRGVAAADLARLGTRFERLDAAPDSGSGLGLAIVSRIVDWHGGRLRFAARSDGRSGLEACVDFAAADAAMLML